MTVEEIEIIVTVQVEEALKEFQKFLPAIKQIMKQAQESFSKVDTKAMTNKLQQTVNFMKKKIQDLKKSSENNEIAIKVNNKDAEKQITQLEKEIDSLQKKITGRQLKLDITNNALDKIKNDTNQSVIKEMPEAGNRRIKQETYKRLDDNINYQSLVEQSDKLSSEVDKYNELLNSATIKMAELERETSKTLTTQNKLSSFFGEFKQKIEQAKPIVSNVKNSFNGLPKITQNITNNIKGMSSDLKNGLKHILKYAGALLSLRGIYSVLSNSARSWLSSQNAGAQQLSADIEYMKYAMGSVFAPVIQYVINLVYQLMKAIQSLAYAFTGVNIFAKATASSMKSASGSAKQASKSLSGIHSEINNVSDNKNSGGSGTTSPNMDLSQMDAEISSFSQKLYDFFKPILDSWNKYGPQVISALKSAFNEVGQAISTMWKSLETLFTTGTIYSIIANILNSIGQIGTAWANAWNNNNNGTEIIQGIADMINNITKAILKLVSSTGFQSFLDGIISAFSGIVQFIEPIVSGLSDMAGKILEIAFSAIGDVLKTVGDALQAIAQNEIVVEILKAVGEVITILVGAIVLWNVAQAILNGLMGLFTILTSPITLIILAIIAAITAIILVVKNWGTISEWFQDLWIKITEKLQEIWNNIKEFFVNLWNSIINTIKTVWVGIKEFLSNLWNGILNIVKTVFNAIATFFSNIWDGIKNVVTTVWNTITSTISNVINGIKNTISNVLNGIRNVWNNIWNGLKTTVTNIFNGIWNTIKRIINSILGGIEGMANGVVKGINKVISVMNNLSFDIPDWVPGMGGKKFGFNIGYMSEVSLPRLAKGNVAYDKTLAIFGEYAGASNNPEITTPQNIMRETFEDVLSNYNNESNDRPIYLTVNVGSTKLGQILLDNLRDMKRQSGKDIEALVGG